VLNVKKRKKLNLVVFGFFLTVIGFVVHSYLAGILEVFPNAGISFGLYCNLLLVVAFVALVVVMILFWRREDVGLMIMAVGGLINFVDRIVFGYVRDYWVFGYFYNNLADLIIVFGVLYSMLALWKKR
jgi:lipoprotein signal peptidase